LCALIALITGGLIRVAAAQDRDWLALEKQLAETVLPEEIGEALIRLGVPSVSG